MWKFASAVAVAAVLTSASVAFGGDGAHHPITLSGTTVQRNIVDTGEPGFTLGDTVAFTNDLRAGGKPAGSDGGVCTLVRIADADEQSGTAQCQLTYSLDGGQITAQGLFELGGGGFENTQHAAITGGTGRFRGAGGEAQLKFLSPGQLQVTLKLSR